MSEFYKDVQKGERFTFGANWSLFLKNINEDRIKIAEESLCLKLEVENLNGKSFIDIGSGSGLFSLAARRLGAHVHSFDYDLQSVACTQELRRRYFPDDADWVVEEGSVLDTEYLQKLGKFDIVYSWGVLHHTGQMWQALKNVSTMVKDGGKLFIAIYNDQGRISLLWLKIKQTYNWLPASIRWMVVLFSMIRLWLPTTIRDFLYGKPFHTWRNYHNNRGMSPWRDVVDWVGGLPFEVAKPEKIFKFYKDQEFLLVQLETCGGKHGCNQYVFVKCKTSNVLSI